MVIKRVIFTCYDDLKVSKEEQDTKLETNTSISNYFDRLIQNKKKYAEKIGVEFKFYHNVMKDFDVPGQLEFTKANLYKHHLFDQLADEYDEVMYVDMDVIFNTEENIFEELDLSKGIHVKDQNNEVIGKDPEKLLFSRIGLRSPTLKYHITKDLLDGEDNDVLNTGIMIAKSEHIKNIKFIERMAPAIEKIEKIRCDFLLEKTVSFMRPSYYANNESIFSYILKKYNIPYIIMEDEWHNIIDDSPREKIEGKVLHFINKRFNSFFKDKNYCVFSLYIKIEDENLDNPKDFTGDPMPKSKRTQVQLEEYKDQLYENKKQYCEKIGADYVLYERDDAYETFLTRFPDLSEYDVVNLYKIYVLEQLSKEYDYVLYLDFDVYCRRNVNFFDFIGTDASIGCLYHTRQELSIPKLEDNDTEYFDEYTHDFRSPHSKYWNAHALLFEEGFDGDNKVFNTGIVGVSKNSMQMLDYFSDIEKIIETMKDIKQFSIYPPKVANEFGYDNETIFSYKVTKNNVLAPELDHVWHYKHVHNRDYRSLNPGTPQHELEKSLFNGLMKEKDPVFVHFISKNFALVFD